MSGYVIAQIDLKSKEGYKEYADKVPDTVKNFGGEYLVRAGEFIYWKVYGILKEM